MPSIESASAAREYAASRWSEMKAESAARGEAAAQARFDDRVEQGKAAAAARPRPQDLPVPIAERLVDITV